MTPEPENLEGGLARLRRDLAAAPVRVDVTVFDHPHPPDFLVGLSDHLADQAQQLVVLDAPPAGRTWPPCPLYHRHPRWPEMRDGAAAWVCPADATLSVPIGELAGGRPD